MGYLPADVVVTVQVTSTGPWQAVMQDIKAGFGRTMSRLPEVFGVSRQALYNWMNGETPRETHHARLRELAEAARAFKAADFTPSSAMLDRTVAQGKSLLELLHDGAQGQEMARKLMRIVQRGAQSRASLDDILGGRRASIEPGDLGAPALREDL
jgi:transcriptional regulator with XRE-family HTH domain